MSDMTFIETQEGWLYLAGVIDAYSRKIVGWAMGSQHDAELVKHALAMALLQRQPAAGLVHHSDRGSEYTSQTYQDMLQQHNIQVSMSKKGDCYDNAVIESFWGTLKEECVGRNVFPTRSEAKTAIFDYIEVFYNRKRKHSTLGYMSPDMYEKARGDDKI
jgi:transposase InsO family protein